MRLLSSECVACKSSLIELRLMNRWSINRDVFYGIALGVSVSLTGFIVYKAYRFNKNLKDSIKEIDELKRKVGMVLLDLTHIDEARIGQTEKYLNLSRGTVLGARNELKEAAKPVIRRQRALSTASMSDYQYETPNTSPPDSEITSESDESDAEDFQDPIEDNLSVASLKKPLKSVLKKKAVEAALPGKVNFHELVRSSLENIRNFVDNCEKTYLEDDADVDKLLEYLMGLVALAERDDKDHEARKSLYSRCLELAKKAVGLNDRLSETHKWLAVSIGRLIDFMGIKEKVSSSVEFKKHLDIAIELDPQDYFLLHMRGHWAYRMCSLNWAEKYAVKLVYGEVPKVTIDSCLEDFLKVESLFPNKMKANLMQIGK